MQKPPNLTPRKTLGLLMLLMAVAQLDRQILGITLEQIGTEFDLSDTQLGMLSGLVFALAFAIFGFPVAALAARTSRRSVISGSVLVWSSMTLFAASAQSFAGLVLARIGVGAGEAGSVAPAHSLISDLFPPERRASAMSVFATGGNLGVLLAFLVGGVVGQFYGWRAAFVVAGVPGVLLGLLLYWQLREPRVAPTPRGPIFAQSLALLRQDTGLRQVSIAIGLTGIVTFGALAWGPTYLIREYGLTQTQTGLFLALSVGIGGAIGTILSGHIADTLGAKDARWRLRFVALTIIFGKPFVLVFLFSGGGALGLVAMTFSFFVANTFWGPTFAYAHSRVPVHCRPMITAFLLFVFNFVGVGIGPTIIGIVSDWLGDQGNGIAIGFVLLQVLGLIGAWMYWRAASYAKDTPLDEDAPQMGAPSA